MDIRSETNSNAKLLVDIGYFDVFIYPSKKTDFEPKIVTPSFVKKAIEFALQTYREQAHKSCSGILSLVRKVGAQRLADACRWADNIGEYSYQSVEEILTKRLDQLSPDEVPQDLPSHDNIRGKGYYK